MDSLAELIAKFDREHPEDMRIAREELKRRPLTSENFSCVDITEVLLCHEIARLRADYALLADDYMQLLGDVERLRAELAELRRFRKAIMDYDSNLYDALANSDAARKGEGE